MTRASDRAHDGQPPPTSGPGTALGREPAASSTSEARSRPAPPRSSVTPTRSLPPRRNRQTAPRPVSGAAFSLAISTASGPINVAVASISVASNQPVDPPHQTAAQWITAAWVRQSAFPSAHSHGTSYIYGHACDHHQCSFTRLKDARVGDRVVVAAAEARLTYRIERTGLSPKSADALPSWASDSTVPNRLVLVTCAYEQGDSSTENIVVVARLQSA
jgi:LPXTG-site transpeptidase (sortase) family protein